MVVEVKCSLDMSLFYRKTRGLVNRSVHKTPTFIIEPIFRASRREDPADHAGMLGVNRQPRLQRICQKGGEISIIIFYHEQMLYLYNLLYTVLQTKLC